MGRRESGDAAQVGDRCARDRRRGSGIESAFTCMIRLRKVSGVLSIVKAGENQVVLIPKHLHHN